MKPINYLTKHLLPLFKDLLKVDNKEILLIKNREYQEFSIIDEQGNNFKINFNIMVKNSGMGQFEINYIFYKYISSWLLRHKCWQNFK